MRPLRVLPSTLFVTLLLFQFVSTAYSVAPSKEAIAKWKAEGVWEQKVKDILNFWAAGGDAPNPPEARPFLPGELKDNAGQMSTVDTQKVLVILMEFPDYKHDDTLYEVGGIPRIRSDVDATPQTFDSLLFSRQGVEPVYNPTGSMTEFYLANSFGKYLIEGTIVGWYQAPRDYSWYVGIDDGRSRGPELAGDAIDAAQFDVNYAEYANSSGIVPGVIIIHAGPGAEQGAYGIWSHQSQADGRVYDGVTVQHYTLNPEEQWGGVSSMGVFAHEWGHICGLPDLYELGNNPDGIGLGDWSIMASGSWNNGGQTPANFDAWCKATALDFVEVHWIDSAESDVEIPQVSSEPVVYGLAENPGPPQTNLSFEYWLVENRQPTGFDQYLPGNGLCVYHIIDSVISQNNADRYKVALVQADGRRDLENGVNAGDPDDPLPGRLSVRELHDYTTPSLRTSYGKATEVGIWKVSDSDSLMTADLEVVYTHPWVVFTDDSLDVRDTLPGGDGDSLFEQGETITVQIEVENLMERSWNPHASLITEYQDLEVLDSMVNMGSNLNPVIGGQKLFTPIRVHIPDDFPSRWVPFTMRIYSNRTNVLGNWDFMNDLNFKIPIGEPQILLVDDDNGTDDELAYQASLDRLGYFYETYSVADSGNPAVPTLSAFRTVVWITGHDLSVTGIMPTQITAQKITLLRQYLDGGGNLLLSSPLISDFVSQDPDFAPNYLHLSVTGSESGRFFKGVSTSLVGDSKSYRVFDSQRWSGNTDILATTSGGEEALVLTDSMGTAESGLAGVTFDGTFRTAALSFPFEYIDNTVAAAGFSIQDTLMARIMRFFERGSSVTPTDDSWSGYTLPGQLTLHDNYPNPFNPTTTIEYEIAVGRSQPVKLSIYNLLGQEVNTLVNSRQAPGAYRVTWDGTTNDGKKTASGVYFYRLEQGGQSATKKMVLLK